MYDIQDIVKEARKINADVGKLIEKNWAQVSNDLDFSSGFYDLLHALRAPRVKEVEELVARLFVEVVDAATRLGLDLQKVVEDEYPELKKESKVVRKSNTGKSATKPRAAKGSKPTESTSEHSKEP